MEPDYTIEGRTIVSIRKMTKKELKREGWEINSYHSPAMAIELDDGSIVYASRDEEGNGPGALFGTAKDGTGFYVDEEEG